MKDGRPADERKPLPHDIALEQELLGALLLSNTVFPLVDARVQAHHFFEPLHQEIYDICAKLIRADKPATPTTIGAFLPKDVTVGGEPLRKYLAAMAANATTIVNAPDFAQMVKDLADYRDIIILTEEMGSLRGQVDPTEIATSAIERLSVIVEDRTDVGSPALNMDQAVARAVDAAAAAFQNDGKPRGLPYGLRALDDKTLGAMPAQLIVLAGRPGMGKSALALGIARNMAEAGSKVLFWSGEMHDVDLTHRMLADKMWAPGRRLSYWQISSGKFREQDFMRIRDAAIEVGKLPLRIEQQPGLTVTQIGARARQMKRRQGLDALIVDHLGLVKPSGRYAGNKVQETGEITMGLKVLAKELGIPIILLAQLSRAVEGRDDKRPVMADLRNSGDIEQDADTVLMLYRAAYYEAKKEPPAGSGEFIVWEEKMRQVQNRLDCIVEKQRSGPTGTVRLYCDIACNVVRDEFSEMDDSGPALSDEDAKGLLL